jgi:hypothetical protein
MESSKLAQQGHDHPVRSHMPVSVAAVIENVLFLASSLFQGVREDGHLVIRSFFIDPASEREDRATFPSQPGGIDAYRTWREEIADLGRTEGKLGGRAARGQIKASAIVFRAALQQMQGGREGPESLPAISELCGRSAEPYLEPVPPPPCLHGRRTVAPADPAKVADHQQVLLSIPPGVHDRKRRSFLGRVGAMAGPQLQADYSRVSGTEVGRRRIGSRPLLRLASPRIADDTVRSLRGQKG